MESAPQRRRVWLAPLMILGGASALAFFSFYLLDWSLWQPAPGSGPRLGPLDQLFHFDADTSQNALGNLAQVIAAVLGIVITVVSIVVQLASTRYTPRIADMFFRDRTNLAVLGFFVVAGIDAVWVSLSVAHDFVPRFSIAMSLVLVTLSVLIIVPYFAYVFDFLDPEKIVGRIQKQALAAAIAPTAGGAAMSDGQDKVLRGVEQLADVAMNAISQKDKLIAQGAIDALRDFSVSYLGAKHKAEPGWFTVGAALRRNTDFVSMAGESVDDLGMRRVWLEWKVLRQYQALYNEALGTMPDMNYLLAIDSRYIGDAALELGDDEALRLVVKFFNTYLRATVNGENIRTAYNVLNQYRQLCENVIARAGRGAMGAGGTHLAVEIGGYFRYYGQLAHNVGLGFVTETVAYDLAALCEHAYRHGSSCHDELLRVLLTVDQAAETEKQELMLRGVRKAQAKLATFYLEAGAEAHARLIHADMKDEPPARLRQIRDSLLAVSSKDFWEVIDRGMNFDYLDAARKQKLSVFFSWFPALAGLGESTVRN